MPVKRVARMGSGRRKEPKKKSEDNLMPFGKLGPGSLKELVSEHDKN